MLSVVNCRVACCYFVEMKPRQVSMKTLVKKAKKGELKYVGATCNQTARWRKHKQNFPQGKIIYAFSSNMKARENSLLKSARQGTLQNKQKRSNAPKTPGVIYGIKRKSTMRRPVTNVTSFVADFLRCILW